MPIQELKNNSLGGSLGRIAGQGVGSGLSSLLEGLAEGKLQKMQEEHKKNQLREAFPDLPEGALGFLSSRPEKEQLEYLQGIGEHYRNNPQQEFNPSHVTDEQKEQLRAYLSSPQAMQERTQEEIGKLQRFLNPVQPGDKQMSGLNSIMSAGGSQSTEPRGSSNAVSFPEQSRGVQGEAEPMQDNNLAQSKPSSRGLSLGALGNSKKESQLARERLELQKSAEKRRSEGTPFEREKFESQKEKEARLAGHKEEQHKEKLSKETREYLQPFNAQVEAAENNIRDYKIMKELARKGDLRAGGKKQILAKLGIGDIGQSTDSEIANKISARLGQNASAAFGPGTKLTNFLEQTYQKSLPTLFNSIQGIDRISDLGEKIEEAKIIKHKHRLDVIRENNGTIPWDIDEIVKHRSQKQVDKIEDEAFKIATGSNEKEFKKGNKYSLDDLSKHEGAKIIKDGKKYIIKNGKPVPRGE